MQVASLTMETDKSKAGTVLWALALLAFAGQARAQTTFKYDFGSGPVAAGYTQVLTTAKYSTTAGFGFENGSTVTEVLRDGSDALRGDYITSSKEILFSVKIPQGNYEVTLILGDVGGTSSTTVKAENRRLLFDRVTLASGQTISKIATVNRREVKSVDGTVTMSIKDRELDYYTWDEKLTLRFSGSKIAVCGVELKKVEDALNLFLCGNSTVVDQLDAANEGWCSWGQMITRFLKPGVSVSNYAESGLDAAAFLSMNRLKKILAEAKEGDYVFVEFGHNDQGNGAEPYKANLKKFRDQIVEKKAIPIFVSPTARKGDTDPKGSIGGLAEVMRTTAVELNVKLIDLNSMVLTVMKALGSNNTLAYMDVSHFTEYGAFEVARCVAKGIKELNNTLTPFLLDDMPVFDPAKPDPTNYLTTAGVVSILPDGKAVLEKGTKARFTPAHGGNHLILYGAPGKDEGEDMRILNGQRVPGTTQNGADPALPPR